MRIRVAYVNQLEAKANNVFKLAASRKLAWLTGAIDDTLYIADAAERYGYTAVFLADTPHFVAVRSDLISNEELVTSETNGSIFCAFESTPPGLGEIIVAAGAVDAEALADALGFDLVFYAGQQDGELGFGFFDRNGRVQKLWASENSNDNYLEAIITI